MSGELLNAIGAASAIFLSSAGSAYASAHSGRFALKAHRNLGLKSLVFIVISGVLAIYGLIIGVILVRNFEGDKTIPAFREMSKLSRERFVRLAHNGYMIAVKNSEAS